MSARADIINEVAAWLTQEIRYSLGEDVRSAESLLESIVKKMTGALLEAKDPSLALICLCCKRSVGSINGFELCQGCTKYQDKVIDACTRYLKENGFEKLSKMFAEGWCRGLLEIYETDPELSVREPDWRFKEAGLEIPVDQKANEIEVATLAQSITSKLGKPSALETVIMIRRMIDGSQFLDRQQLINGLMAILDSTDVGTM